jgi:hypothetical protein
MGRTASKALSNCTARAGSGHLTIFAVETNTAGFFWAHIVSTKPLRVGLPCGNALCLGALIGALVYLGVALFTDIHIAAPGFSTLVIVLLISNGLIFLYLGILGEYIGQTFLEVKHRPSFIVERTVNIKEAERADEA